MKIVYTNQSFNSLEDALNFLLEKQGIPVEKVARIKTNYWTGQIALQSLLMQVRWRNTWNI